MKLSAELQPRAAQAMSDVQAGNFQSAETHYSAILDKVPYDYLALNNRGYCRWKLGKYREALEDNYRAFVMQRNGKNAYRMSFLTMLAYDALPESEKNERRGTILVNDAGLLLEVAAQFGHPEVLTAADDPAFAIVSHLPGWQQHFESVKETYAAATGRTNADGTEEE